MKGLTETVWNLEEDDFLLLYADMTKRMKLLKGSPSSNLTNGDRVILHLKDENLDVPSTVTEVMAYGFKVLTDDGIEGHISPDCAYTKISPPKEGDQVTVHTSDGAVQATLLKVMGSVCRVLQSGKEEPKTVPASQVAGLTEDMSP